MTSAILQAPSCLLTHHYFLFCFIFTVHSDISLSERLLVENANFGLQAVGASNSLSLSVCHSFIYKVHPFQYRKL